jgi:D-serine dehydratase
MSDTHVSSPSLLLDDRIRGFPAGHAPVAAGEVGKLGWKPVDGKMSLPLISLDEGAFAANVAQMMAYVRSHGLEIAPHAKTPMIPELARRLVEAGAWGTTVADIRQASVMLKAGMKRLILANEVGGVSAARRLAALLSGYGDAEVHVFVDSLDLARAYVAAWSERKDLPRLGLLPELGIARAGNRTVESALEIADYALAQAGTGVGLTGIGCYEGSAATADHDETVRRIERLMAMTADLYSAVRARVGADSELIVTAGGSTFFDLVTRRLAPALAGDRRAKLILRSGAIFFHDHGTYERGLTALDSRKGLEIDGQVLQATRAFKPVLRVWAEVVSRPEPGLAICGAGLRDVAMDQGLPRPLAVYRDGVKLRDLGEARVTKLNDQHSFVDLAGQDDLHIGDVVEYGISHPCTCLDRHAVLYGLDAELTVRSVHLTQFG